MLNSAFLGIKAEVADERIDEGTAEGALNEVAPSLVAYAGQIGVIIIDSGLPSVYFRRQSL